MQHALIGFGPQGFARSEDLGAIDFSASWARICEFYSEIMRSQDFKLARIEERSES